MKIYDVTRPVYNEMAIFGGDPKVYFERVQSTANGGFCNLGKIDFGLHTGTHVDSPFHFLADGADLDHVPLEHFIGKARVIEFDDSVTVITRELLEPFAPRKGERLLLKTANSFRDPDAGFDPDYVPIDASLAEYVAECGILTLGVDFQTVGKGADIGVCHRTLFNAGICIIEGLRLAEVPAGEYLLSALPLRITGAEGCPVRAVLIVDPE